MKVLKRGMMPDGTKIQIEEWSENYSFHAYADTVASYPTSKTGERFRADCKFQTTEEAAAAFEKLLGGASLSDYNFEASRNGGKIPYLEY